MQVTKQQDYAETMDIDTENSLTESGQPALNDHTMDCPDSFQDIANRLHDRYELEESLKYYSKSLAIRLNKLGEKHPDDASVYYDMSCV